MNSQKNQNHLKLSRESHYAMNNKATYPTSQAQNTKKLKSTAFDLAKLTPSDKKILYYLLPFQNLSFCKLTNATIAKKLGITERTVIRGTNKLAKLGYITKYRENNYTSNEYYFNISAALEYDIWFNRMSSKQQEFFNTHRMTEKKYINIHYQSEYVTRSSSSSSLESLLTNPSHPVHASRRDSEIDGNRLVTNRHTFKNSVNLGFLSKKEETMEAYNPITQVIRDIKSIALTKWGQIRLMAYPDKAISFAEQQMKYATLASVKDPFKLFAFHCVDWCKKNDYKPNFQIVSQLEVAYKAPDDRTFIILSAKPSPVNHTKKNFQQKGGHISPPVKKESPSALRDRLEHWEEVLAQSVMGSRIRAEARAQILVCKQLLGDQWQPARDKPVQTDVVSPLVSSGEATVLEGESYVAGHEVCDSFGANTVEESGNEYTAEIVLRPTEDGQISMWDRVGTPAWRGT